MWRYGAPRRWNPRPSHVCDNLELYYRLEALRPFLNWNRTLYRLSAVHTQHTNTMASDRRWAQMVPDLILMAAAVRVTLVPLQCDDGCVRHDVEDQY